MQNLQLVTVCAESADPSWFLVFENGLKSVLAKQK